MKHDWIEAFSLMTYGIYVLTSADGQTVNGMIASWVTQASYDPPLVIVAVHPNRYSHHLIEKSGAFALHVISRHRRDFLGRFKGPDAAAKFDAIQWRRGKTGSPILDDCIAWLECRVVDRLSPGNHTLFIGEVVAAGASDGSVALSTADYDGVYIGKS
jgi:flavin reductase (DIM6/NTAB) family NADH-FMN oxidoreductase RutF